MSDKRVGRPPKGDQAMLKRVTIRVEDKTLSRLNELKRSESSSLSEIIVKAIEQYLRHRKAIK